MPPTGCMILSVVSLPLWTFPSLINGNMVPTLRTGVRLISTVCEVPGIGHGSQQALSGGTEYIYLCDFCDYKVIVTFPHCFLLQYFI